MSLTDSLNLIARMEGYNPDVKDLPAKQQVKNAKGSGDDVPVFGETWIKYWKIFTKKEIPSVCPLCGNTITEKETEGCHILIKSHPSNGTCDGNGSYEKKNTSFQDTISVTVSLTKSLNWRKTSLPLRHSRNNITSSL